MGGNGGFAGTINYDEMAAGLKQGYATASTDTGHEAGAEDASWAYKHREKVVDYGYRGLHLTTVAAKKIVAAMYGKPAGHSYFDGCSNGGREALMEAQRFPDDFDGILAGAPANNWSKMLSSGIDGRADDASQSRCVHLVDEDSGDYESCARGVRRARRREGWDRQRAGEVPLRS